MEAMKDMADNQFDLAIVDPPYGIGAGSDDRFGKVFNKASARRKDYKKSNWDSKSPDNTYFNNLKRISKNQIVWGVNNYSYDFSGGRIFWDKCVADNYTASRLVCVKRI